MTIAVNLHLFSRHSLPVRLNKGAFVDAQPFLLRNQKERRGLHHNVAVRLRGLFYHYGCLALFRFSLLFLKISVSPSHQSTGCFLFLFLFRLILGEHEAWELVLNKSIRGGKPVLHTEIARICMWGTRASEGGKKEMSGLSMPPCFV